MSLRAGVAAAGTCAVDVLSGPGSGRTALLELLLARCAERGIPAAALTGDPAARDDDARDDDVRPARVLFVENAGTLVSPAPGGAGEPVRVVLTSVTEGEDAPERYPAAYRWADLVVVTKADLAAACAFDDQAFLDAVTGVRPGAEVLATSARTGQGVDALLGRLLPPDP